MFIRLAIITAVCLSFHVPAHSSSRHAAPAGWNEPRIVYLESWPDAIRFSLNDDATRLAALIPNSGSDEHSRHVVVSEYASGTWQEPVVVAQNGAYSDAPFQWLPQETRPVISGDGNTIAYVGYTGSTYGAYVVYRLPGGGWSAPAQLATGLTNTHYWISLSRDGRALALCDYPFFGIQQVHVMERLAGGWSAPRLIGPGGNPSLSADGERLVYVSNARVAFSERIGGQWTTPQPLTANDAQDSMVEYPQISADGRAVSYWLIKLAPSGGAYLRSAQDLYLIRRTGGAWGAPHKVTPTPALPVNATDGPAAADSRATRLIYTRAATMTDPLSGEAVVHASHLEISEWIGAEWRTTRLVEVNGYGNYNRWPRLTPDGRTLTFDGGDRYTTGGPAVHNALWQMRTDVPPPAPPLPLSTGAVITAAGGSLVSEIDGTRYDFGPGTFTITAYVTHTLWLTPSQPPAGLVSIPGIGGLGRGFTATAFTAGGLPLQPLRPVTVTIGYTATGSGLAISGTLRLWRLVPGGWTPVAGANDAGAGVVTAMVSHFSQFAVFGQTQRAFLPSATR